MVCVGHYLDDVALKAVFSLLFQRIDETTASAYSQSGVHIQYILYCTRSSVVLDRVQRRVTTVAMRELEETLSIGQQGLHSLVLLY